MTRFLATLGMTRGYFMQTLPNLYPDETVLRVVHKHWFLMARAMISLLLLAALPLAIPFIPTSIFAPIGGMSANPIGTALGPFNVPALIHFAVAIYYLIIIAFLFFAWMDYYLDLWIITNKRIIDIDQRGFFSREIAEIPLDRVQDVTLDVIGIIQTILRFGTIRIQTAGEQPFMIDDIPDLQGVKDLILQETHKN